MNINSKKRFKVLIAVALTQAICATPAQAVATTAPQEVVLTADGVDSNELKVSWKKPVTIYDVVAAYQVELFGAESDAAVSEALYSIDTGNKDNPVYEIRISHLVDGATQLSNGTLYRAKVTAIDIHSGRATSSFTSLVAPYGVPDAPSNVTAIRSGSAEVQLSWESPTGNGSPVSSFKVICTPACGTVDPTTSDNSITLRGLNPEKTYTFKVQAANARDWSVSSTTSNEVVPFGAIAAASAVSITPENGTLSVDWPDISVRGAVITKYVVELFLTSDLSTLIASAEPTRSDYKFENLTNGTAYTVRVVGYVGMVAGSQKFSSSASPMAPPVVTPPVVTPPVVSQPTASPAGPAPIAKGAKVAGSSVASNIGMNVPAKSKVSIVVAKSSKKTCSVSGGKLKALAPGGCTVTVTVTAPKPAAVKIAGGLEVSAGAVISGASAASQLGASVPAGSKLTVKVASNSRKVCSVAGKNIRSKTGGTCNVNITIQAPQPKPVKQTSTISVS